MGAAAQGPPLSDHKGLSVHCHSLGPPDVEPGRGSSRGPAVSRATSGSLPPTPSSQGSPGVTRKQKNQDTQHQGNSRGDNIFNSCG